MEVAIILRTKAAVSHRLTTFRRFLNPCAY